MTLPIDAAIPELLAALRTHHRVVLAAPPGAGKTTQVPLALRSQSWIATQRIIMLEPRRVAARAAAHRMASLLGERPGETVGYRTRLDTRIGPSTRIEVVTEGVLTRMLRHDLSLPGVGIVIFDEFHERSLAADTGLALVLAAAESLRPDLRILVMSATLDHLAVAELLGNAPVIESLGRAWPVETLYLAPRAGAWIESHVAHVVRDAVRDDTGSLLVFLAGAGEIGRVAALLDHLPDDVDVHPLYGALTMAQQDAAIAPAPTGRRKVVLATSIAETSLTIDGVRIVVDSGWMRVPRFSARTGMTRLATVRVSRASADQRRGRAGRTAPGSCIRCWSHADDAGLVPYHLPEIVNADLAPLWLDLLSAGFHHPDELRWLDPPPAAALDQARELLRLLGGLDQRDRLTPHGAAMADLPMHPRLAHMMIHARREGADALATAATLAALLEERDVLRGSDGPPLADVQLRLDAVAHDVDEMMLAHAVVDRSAVARVRDAARRLAPRRGEMLPAGNLLALAYPDRVAQRRGAPGRFLLRNGRGAMLPASDPLAQAEWIVAADIDDAGREGRITLAAALDRDDIVTRFGEDVLTVDEIAWDDQLDAVVAQRRTMLGALVLRTSAIADADPDAMRSALLAGVRHAGIDRLPWSAAARALRARLNFLHRHDPDWPDVSDAALLASLDEWLAPQLDRVRDLAGLARVDLDQVLRDRLAWEQRRDFDALAPERIEVPSGSRIAVDYTDTDAPTLAVRLQEVFGMMETPRIMSGTVPVTLQLLSPARRPVQVTRDLASFWRSGYFDVRKDLRGRYPKHDWPEDPLRAAPSRRTKRNGGNRQPE